MGDHHEYILQFQGIAIVNIQTFIMPIPCAPAILEGATLTLTLDRGKATTSAYMCVSSLVSSRSVLFRVLKTGPQVRMSDEGRVISSGSLTTDIQINNAADHAEIWLQQTQFPVEGGAGALNVFHPATGRLATVTEFQNSSESSFTFDNENAAVWVKNPAGPGRHKLTAYDAATKEKITQLEQKTGVKDNAFMRALYSQHPTTPPNRVFLYNDSAETCLYPVHGSATPDMTPIAIPSADLDGREVHTMLETRAHRVEYLFTNTTRTVDEIVVLVTSLQRGVVKVCRLPCRNFVMAGEPCVNPVDDTIQVINRNTGTLIALDVMNEVSRPVAPVPLDVNSEIRLQCDDQGASFIFGLDHLGQSTLVIIESS